MALNGGELRTRVLYSLGNRTDKDAEVLAAVDHAQKRIASLVRVKALQGLYTGSVPAAAEYIVPPADTQHILSVWIVVGEGKIRLKRATTFRHDAQNKSGTKFPAVHISGLTSGGDTGQPRMYGSYGTNIWLYPVPTEATTIWFRVQTHPATITAATTHSLGDGWDNAIVAFATEEMMYQLELWVGAQRWEKRAFRLLREAIRGEEYSPDFTPSQNVDGASLTAVEV